MNIYVDGASNEFGSAYCVIIQGEEKDQKILKVFENKFGSYKMEFEALLLALEKSNDGDIIYTDCKNLMTNLHKYKLIKNYLKIKPNVKIYWRSRKENIAGVYLEHRLRKLQKETKNILNPKIKLTAKEKRKRKAKYFKRK